MKTARITATAAIGLMLFISISIMLAVLLASPGSQADAPSGTLNISPVSEVLTGYTSSAADETLPTPANCSGCDSPNLKRRFLYNGEWIDEVVVPGPPQRPITAESASGIEPRQSYAGDHRLSNIPAFDWCYGCSATSAAMMFGYYDRTGYPNMYAGPTNGGVCPLDNSVWGVKECPLSATHKGYDNLSTNGSVDDYWYSADSTIDPYFGNWSEHGYANCTADYMGTNQYHNWWNIDGATTFYYYTSCNPLYDYTGNESFPIGNPYRKRDGAHGIRLFVESRGYNLYWDAAAPNWSGGYGAYRVFNQYIKGICTGQYKNNGFTYDQYKAEIDAGRPVLIQLDGHTMIGFGYNSSNSVIDIHDTWDHSDHVMTWGGSYGGMAHLGVTVLQMGSIPVTPTPSPTCTGTCPTPTPTATTTPTCGWTVIMTEDLESGFPGSKWSLQGNASSGGHTWDDESYKPHNGSYSAWCAGSVLAPPGPYVNYMSAWMVYGPFNLSDAFYADMKFYFWCNSQQNADYLYWLASPNGSNFFGWRTSGNLGGWYNVTFDLTSVPNFGNMCGDSSVWVAFLFVSNASGTAEGAYIDDIVLGKNVSCPTPTPSPSPTISPTVSPTASPSPSPSASPSPSPTPSPSPSPSPSASPSPSPSPSASPSPSPSPSTSPSPSPSPSASPSPSPSPSASPSPSPSPSASASPSASPSPSPSPSPTPTPKQYGDASEDGYTDSFDLGVIRNMILVKSPVYPGGDANADGMIDSFDLGVVRNIILEKTTARDMHSGEYAFSSGAGSDRWAKRNNITAPPPALNMTFDTDPTGWVEATSGQYTNISAGDVWTIAGDSGNYTALQCKFTVAEGAYAGNITSIGVTFNGSSQDSGDLLQLWAWNFTAGAWRQLGSDISLGNTSNQAYIKWTAWGKVYADYIDASSYMYILYAHDTSGKYLNADYVKLEIVSPE